MKECLKEKSGALISSYKVFNSFIDRDASGKPDVSGIFSTYCYEYWIKTRKTAPKKPHESFRRCLTAHTRGSDGRKPFAEDAEAKILEVLRQKKRWPCFEKHEVSIGVQGFKALGFHEAKRKNGNQNGTNKTDAVKTKMTKSAKEVKKKSSVKVKSEFPAKMLKKSEAKELKETASFSLMGDASISVGRSSEFDMEIDTKVPPERLVKKQKVENILEPDTVLNELFRGHKPQDFGHGHTGFKPSFANMQPFATINTNSQYVGPPQFLRQNSFLMQQQPAGSGSIPQAAAKTTALTTTLKQGIKRPRPSSSCTSSTDRREDAEKEEADFSFLMKMAQLVNKNNGQVPMYFFQNQQTFMNPNHLSEIVRTSQKQGCELFNPAGLYMLSITRDPNDPRFQMDYLVPESQCFDMTKTIGCNLVSLKSFIHVDTDEISREIMKGDMRDIHGWAMRASRVEAYLTCRYGYPRLLKDGHVWMHRRVYTFDGRVLVLKVHMTLLEDKNHVFVRFQDVSNEMEHILSPPNELF
mmetsp:Transcript_17536/g.21225  ORF Transcript_17536/g.21225 Transcript_17536/m.21225 type:complete len:524 (+) Transcript_17536:265-1836(+)